MYKKGVNTDYEILFRGFFNYISTNIKGFANNLVLSQDSITHVKAKLKKMYPSGTKRPPAMA